MRSELVFGAASNVPNRYLLAKLVARATRGLHKPNTRIQDTTNDVLILFVQVKKSPPEQHPQTPDEWLPASQTPVAPQMDYQMSERLA